MMFSLLRFILTLLLVLGILQPPKQLQLPCIHSFSINEISLRTLYYQQHNRKVSMIVSSSSSTITDDDDDSNNQMTILPTKGILYDVPVSNNGARCRLILYKKNITSDIISIQSPSSITNGGIRSELFQYYNPQMKTPVLVLYPNNQSNTATKTIDDTSLLHISESDTIARYLLHEYEHMTPHFDIHNVRSNLIVRYHDMYITTIQNCLYKANPPFGIFHIRKDAILEIQKQIQILNNLIIDSSSSSIQPDDVHYLCGTNISLADVTIFPTLVFISYIMPKFDPHYTLPYKLQHYYQQITKYDIDFATIQNEIINSFQIWEHNHRWDTILGAGWKDDDPTIAIVDQIMNGTIPVSIISQSDDKIIAYHSMHPVTPAHVIIIPKERYGLTQLSKATLDHTEILGRLLVAAASIARNESLGFGDGSRVVINDGMYSDGQDIMHLHVHVLGGRPMTWPPG